VFPAPLFLPALVAALEISYSHVPQATRPRFRRSFALPDFLVSVVPVVVFPARIRLGRTVSAGALPQGATVLQIASAPKPSRRRGAPSATLPPVPTLLGSFSHRILTASRDPGGQAHLKRPARATPAAVFKRRHPLPPFLDGCGSCGPVPSPPGAYGRHPAWRAHHLSSLYRNVTRTSGGNVLARLFFPSLFSSATCKRSSLSSCWRASRMCLPR
jgi:hypothetical protein